MTTLDALWEALAADIHANGYSVRDAIDRHRPTIEAAVWNLAEEACAEARAEGLDVERLREAVDAALFDAEMDDSHPGCHAKWRRVAMGAFDAATSA